MNRISRLIEIGEGEMLDFKREISDSSRIARSIVSFANHKGGTLLIGVDDDGSIAGIQVEEERHMVSDCLRHYVRPELDLQILEWSVKNKMILEVIVPEGKNKPYYAIDENGKAWVYVRQHDQCLLASKVVVEVMKRRSNETSVPVAFGSKEEALFDYLRKNRRIYLKEYCRLVNISRWRATRILSGLIHLGVIRVHQTEKPEYYTLGNE